MLQWFSYLNNWILSLLDKVPEETKDRVIETVVDAFSELLKSYYRNKKSDNSEDEAHRDD
jgi:hypothetical protein